MTIVYVMQSCYFLKLMNAKGNWLNFNVLALMSDNRSKIDCRGQIERPRKLQKKLYFSNYMMAREINNLLQSEYVDTGIVDFNFHCSVFDEGTDI